MSCPCASQGTRDKKATVVFKPRWMDNVELAEEGLVVGSRMFKLHWPDVQTEVMTQVGRWCDSIILRKLDSPAKTVLFSLYCIPASATFWY